MANFSFNNFFEAFNTLRAKSSTTVKNALSSLKSCGRSNNTNQCQQTCYDTPDVSPKLDCGCNSTSNTNNNTGFCRHDVQESKPQCQKPQQQQHSCNCQKERPKWRFQWPGRQRTETPAPAKTEQYNIEIGDKTVINNSGFMGGPGNDTLIMNYNEQTFNTSNTFNTNINNTTTITNTTINNNPTVEPTPAPTPTPTPTPDPTPTPTPTEPDPGPGGTDTYNLMPLMSLLTQMEAAKQDGILSDSEFEEVMNNPGLADMDNDTDNISAEEMAILNKIKQFNENKDLISKVIKGDISSIEDSTLDSLQELSDAIKKLRGY